MAVGDMELGPCQVSFGTEDSETDLGRTEGGVVVSFIQDVADLLSDQYGTQPEDQIITGTGATIVVPMAEITFANLSVALNIDTSAGGGLIEGSSLVGTKLYDQAESLLLKRYVDGSVSSDEEDWIRFPKAASQGNFELGFSKDGQRIMEVTFIAFRDRTSEDLYYIGDESES